MLPVVPALRWKGTACVVEPHMVGIEGILTVYIQHNQSPSWVVMFDRKGKVVECQSHSGMQVVQEGLPEV